MSDTSPILNLALIDRLDLLRAQFGAILIPPAVLRELKRPREERTLPSIASALREGWIEERRIEGVDLARELGSKLDDGESEAIVLARESRHVLVIDEKSGRRVARNLRIDVIGLVGILVRAKADGRVELVSAEFEKLRREANFFLSDRRVRETLVACGEASSL